MDEGQGPHAPGDAELIDLMPLIVELLTDAGVERPFVIQGGDPVADGVLGPPGSGVPLSDEPPFVSIRISLHVPMSRAETSGDGVHFAAVGSLSAGGDAHITSCVRTRESLRGW